MPAAITDTVLKPMAVLSDFSFDQQDRCSENASYRRCTRKDTGMVYAVKMARTNSCSTIRERSILEEVTEKNVPFAAHLKWAFQDGEHSYWVIVSFAVQPHHRSNFTFSGPL